MKLMDIIMECTLSDMFAAARLVLYDYLVLHKVSVIIREFFSCAYQPNGCISVLSCSPYEVFKQN